MNKTKRILALALVTVLICVASAAGSYAYLTDKKSVINNFSFAPAALFDDGGITIDEHEAIADTEKVGIYTLGTGEVTENSYILVPPQSVPKDPKVNIKNLSTKAYLFVEVCVSKSTGVEYSVNSSNWTKLQSGGADVTGSHGGTVYYHPDILNPGKTTQSFYILAGDTAGDYPNGYINAGSNYDTVNGSFTMDFYAYICQSSGFAGALEAWNGFAGAALKESSNSVSNTFKPAAVKYHTAVRSYASGYKDAHYNNFLIYTKDLSMSVYVRLKIITCWSPLEGLGDYYMMGDPWLTKPIGYSKTDWYYNPDDGYYYYRWPISSSDKKITLIEEEFEDDYEIDVSIEHYKDDRKKLAFVTEVIQAEPASVIKDCWGVSVEDLQTK